MKEFMTTWRKELQKRLDENKDVLIACTLTEEELDIEFDKGYGLEEGLPFTAWSKKWVYFPVSYDGSEWVGCVPRKPCNISTQHIGG
jgi:hypothetical protein